MVGHSAEIFVSKLNGCTLHYMNLHRGGWPTWLWFSDREISPAIKSLIIILYICSVYSECFSLKANHQCPTKHHTMTLRNQTARHYFITITLWTQKQTACGMLLTKVCIIRCIFSFIILHYVEYWCFIILVLKFLLQRKICNSNHKFLTCPKLYKNNKSLFMHKEVYTLCILH